MVWFDQKYAEQKLVCLPYIKHFEVHLKPAKPPIRGEIPDLAGRDPDYANPSSP